MGIGTDVFEAVRYEGESCVHHVLLRAGRPSYPNADQGAEDAADAFAESAMAHLRGWFERWRLPRLCPAEHEVSREGFWPADEQWEELEGPGFRWVDVAGTRAFLLTDNGADGDLRDA